MKAIRKTKEDSRKEEIIEVAAKLFEKKGFRGTTCENIAKEMGFTKAAIYYHFDSKETILKEVNDRASRLFLENAKDIISSDLRPDEKLDKILRSHIRMILENLTWIAVFFRERRELPRKFSKGIFMSNKRYTELLRNVYKAGVEQRLFKDVPPFIAISAIFGPANLLYAWYDPHGDYSPEDIEQFYSRILNEGYLAKNVRDTKAE
jgi:AcrR family transcriptional regulator